MHVPSKRLISIWRLIKDYVVAKTWHTDLNIQYFSSFLIAGTRLALRNRPRGAISFVSISQTAKVLASMLVKSARILPPCIYQHLRIILFIISQNNYAIRRNYIGISFILHNRKYISRAAQRNRSFFIEIFKLTFQCGIKFF